MLQYINLTASSLHNYHYGISEGKVTPQHNVENFQQHDGHTNFFFFKFVSIEMVLSFDRRLGNAVPLNIYTFHLNQKTLSCSGHLN